MNILLHNYDIIILTETWLHADILDSEFIDSRYCLYRCDRDRISTGRKDGGGVLVAVLRGLAVLPCLPLPVAVCPSPAPIIDFVLLEIRLCGGITSLLSAVYIPPNQHVDIYSSYTEYIEHIVYERNIQTYCIVGDYNSSTLDWHSNGLHLQPVLTSRSTLIDKKLASFSTEMNCIQLNTVRNKNNKLLDLVLTNIVDCKLLPAPVSLIPVDEYHPPFYFLVPVNFNLKCIPSKIKTYYFFKGANYSLINEELSKVDWDDLFKDKSAESAVNSFYEVIYGLIKKHVPVKFTKSSRFPPWFTSSLIHIFKNKNQAWIRWKKYGNRSDYEIFSLYRERFKKESQKCHREYICRVESSIKDNIKFFWTFVSNHKNIDDIPNSVYYKNKVTDEPHEVCSLFSDFFHSVFEPSSVTEDFNMDNVNFESNYSNDTLIHNITFTYGQISKELKLLDASKGTGTDNIPAIFLKFTASTICKPLHYLFNKCLHEGVCPTIWKSARVVPIHKGGCKRNIENYRPISILPALSKLLERLVHNIIYPIIHNNIIPQQHGFVERRSTSTNLLLYTSYLFDTLDKNKQTDSVYTDFRKAFDTIDHKRLLEKIAYNGIRGNLWRWFKSYITNRTQKVIINGYESNNVPISSGVPQGSILGPLLFIIFINDIYTCFNFCKILLYADDLKIYHIIDTPNDHILFQEDLNRFTAYCKINKLTLSLHKCKTITFTRKRNISNFSYTLCNCVLDNVQTIKDLGLTLDTRLVLDTHIDNIVAKAYRMYGFVMRCTNNFKKPTTYLYLYKNLIRSQLEYAVTIWNPIYKFYCDKIEMVQKKFLRRLQYKFSHNRRSYDQLLYKYNLQDLKSRRIQLEIMILYDIIQGKYDCISLTNQINYKVPVRTQMRNSRRQELFAINRYRTNSGIRSPINRILKIYNDKFYNIDIFATKPLTFKKMVAKQLVTSSLSQEFSNACT